MTLESSSSSIDLESVLRRLRQLEANEAARKARLGKARRIASVVAAGVLVSLPGLAVALDPVHRFSDGDVISAEQINEDFAGIYQAFTDRVIRENLTVSVPASEGCDGLRNALTTLDEFQIGSAAVVTIQLGLGEYNCEAPVTIRHPNGDRLEIAGGASPADVVIRFPATSNGFEVSNGRSLAELRGVSLVGGGSGVGFRVSNGSNSRLEASIVSGFQAGVQSFGNSMAQVSEVDAQANEIGFSCQRAGHFRIDASRATNNSGSGVEASEGCSVRATAMTANGNDTGFRALTGGVIVVSDSEASDNTSRGFYALVRGTLQARTTTALRNVTAGYDVDLGAFVDVGDVFTPDVAGSTLNVADTTGAIIISDL